jgi:hypothetical protein
MGGGTLLNILMSEQKTPFCIHERFKVGLCNQCLAVVIILCTTVLVKKLSRLLTVNISSEDIYFNGTGRISIFLNKRLQERLELTAIIILLSFFGVEIL